MKIVLKQFQIERVEELAGELEAARAEAARGRLQAVTLAAPTGSGKTVIATSVIERILEGDDEHPSDPEAVFLWITDQPELNEQTRQKMLATSSVLTRAHLVVINGPFDQESLTPGRVYFLNTQKLGRNSNLVRPGDERNYTLWETLSSTIEMRPTSFYVVIDEAHRGMREGPEGEEAQTIIQKFIVGSAHEIPPVPLIIGISATLARFDQYIGGTTRVRRPIEVPIADVRESGLIKEVVNLFHPDETQPADVTMLRAAARSLLDYTKRWEQYGLKAGEPLIRPILLVQVQDGTQRQLSRTDLSEALQALNDELGTHATDWYANAFQEGVPVTVDGTAIRYLAPSAIDADPNVRVVFFKTSLNTGWDCPRAEVMMSYRSATDDTVIAQLVGRMVRAPLARRVDNDEHLNTVALYLPHYDRTGLEHVVARLSAGDPMLLPPTTVREGRESVLLTRVERSAAIFKKLETLPSYVVPKKSRDRQTKRLGKLATLLSRYGIDDTAPDKAQKKLVDVLLDAYRAQRDTRAFKDIVKDSGVLDVRVVSWQYGEANLPEDTVQVEISDENVEDLFSWAGKRFGEGLHILYWKARVKAGARNHMRTKLEAFALASSQEVVEKLERAARAMVQQWFSRHEDAIAELPEGGHAAFNEVRQLASEPELTMLPFPETVEWAQAETNWKRHVYVDSGGRFPSRFNTWETKTLEQELARDDVVAWLRNPDRKPWSLCIPYEMGGEWKSCYPDFLVVRKTNGGLVVDIVDPHLLSFEDAWQRAKGLAQYAARHADKFGRIDLIRVEDGVVQRVDVKDEETRTRMLAVSSNAHLRELFNR